MAQRAGPPGRALCAAGPGAATRRSRGAVAVVAAPGSAAAHRLARPPAARAAGDDGHTLGAERLIQSAAASGIQILPVLGIGEVLPGSDLSAVLLAALAAQGVPLLDGDIV